MLDNIITLAIILRKDNIFFYYNLLFEYIFLSHQQNIFPPAKQHQHIKKISATPQHRHCGYPNKTNANFSKQILFLYFCIYNKW